MPSVLEGRARLEGTTLAGGERSRGRLSKLLGVAAVTRFGFSVRSVAWVSDHVEVEIEQPDAEPVVFSIERRQADRPGLLSVNRLNVFYKGDALAPRLEAVVRAVASKALARLSIEDLAEMLIVDPEAGRSVEPLPEAPAREQRSYDEQALLATWGSPAVWTSFFAVAEVARSQLDSLDFFDRCTFVQHCDLECLCVNPQVGVPLVPLVRYPWDDGVRGLDWSEDTRRARAVRRDRGDGSPGMVTTDLDERDVVLGRGPQVLRNAIESLRGRHLGAMVFCSTTCVPVVEGEDVQSVIDQFSGEIPVPVLSLTTTPQSMQGVFRDLLIRRRLEAEAQAPPPRSDAINLIGFPDAPATLELERLLGLVGARVNVRLLPALAPELVDAFPAASLAVLHPNELWRGLYDQLLFDSRMRSVSPPAPYGQEATVMWLETVARALGLETDARAAIESDLERHAEAWCRLVQRSSRHRLGFVVRDRDVRHLADPAQSWGIPLLRMIEEMGFGLVVLVHAADPAAARSEQLRPMLEDPARMELRTFESRGDLDGQLRAAGVSALYSEHVADRRATEAGLATFSGQYFEHGLDGAIRTLARLLEVCELPFFRRYGASLTRTREERGLPHPLGIGLHDAAPPRST
jgi:hypothetical protein